MAGIAIGLGASAAGSAVSVPDPSTIADFKLRGQTKGKKPITLLKLNGPKPQCGQSRAKKSDARIARKRRRSRHLWGSGKGRFPTTGQFSSATVRGTIWLTQDTCKGTLVKVKLAVKDFTRHKTFLVKAGHRHLAPPPRRHHS